MAQKRNIDKDSTNVTLNVTIKRSDTGMGLTGLAYNTASLVAYYVRPAGVATAITLATQTTGGAHSDGGFVEISSTNMPGVYRLDLPDAVCATGVNEAKVMLKGATNMLDTDVDIELIDVINSSNPIAANTVQWNSSAVATPTTAGVPEVDLTHIAGAAVSTTTAQLGVNVEAVNNVALTGNGSSTPWGPA